MFLQFVLVIAFLAGILIFSKYATKYAIDIANILGTSYFTIGFVLVAISTSLPEFFVGIQSSLIGHVEIAITDVLGSNIANIALIMGLMAFVYGFKVSNIELKRNSIFLLMMGAIPLFFLISNSLSVFEGLILVGVFFMYIHHLLKIERHPLGVEKLDKEVKYRKWTFERIHTFLKSLALFAVAIAGTLICSNELVTNSVYLIETLFIPPAFVGATIIAIGTSLPELATSWRAVQKGHTNLCFGTLIGSCITNLSLVLGTSAIVAGGFAINGYGILIGIILFICLIIYHAFLANNKIDKTEGLMLLIIYAAFITYQISTLL